MKLNNIINFFKKTWLWLLFMSLLLLSILYFIPSQEKYYLRTDYKLIEKRSIVIALIFAGVISLFILVNFVKNFTRIAELPSVFLGIGSVVVLMYFVLAPFIQSGILFLNKLAVKETVTKDYVVQAFNNDKRFLIFYDIQNKETVGLNYKYIIADTSKIQRTDTISIPFKKGLLGFNYIPEPVIK